MSSEASNRRSMPNPQIGAYQITPHGYQIKVLAPGVDANVFAICGCASVYGRACWCPHNRQSGLCPECESGDPPHHFVWCPLYGHAQQFMDDGRPEDGDVPPWQGLPIEGGA